MESQNGSGNYTLAGIFVQELQLSERKPMFHRTQIDPPNALGRSISRDVK